MILVYIRQALREGTLWNLTGAEGYFVQVSIEVEGVGERFTHIDIGEEITGDTVSIKFPAAHQVFVALDGNGEAEEEYRVGYLRQTLNNGHIGNGLHLRQILLAYINGICIASTEHQQAGGKLRDVLDNSALKSSWALPVIIEAAEQNLSTTLIPGIQLEGAGSVSLVIEGHLFKGLIIPFRPGVGITIPSTVCDHPVLVQNRCPGATLGEDVEERRIGIN